MKKVMISLLAGASVLSLVACAPKRYERQSKPKTATSSAVKKEKKDTGQKHYQEVLERYAKYDTALKNGDKAGLFAELGKSPAGSEENIYLDALERLGTPVTFQYVFTDLNQDGVDELLVSNQYTGNKQYVSAIYYLKGQKAELLHTAYTAAVGGYRSSLDIFDNGQIVYATWQSVNPEMELTLYSLGKGEAKEEKKATIQIGGKETAEQALGISAKKLDLTKLDWKNFDGTGDSKSTAKAEEKKSGSFQVQVSVADLRIRKEPSTSASSAGMIAKGTHTITETVDADGHTWGKLESGQGWIALDYTTRVDGSKSASSSKKSSGMNIQEIQNGDFSSIAGTWRNGKGWTLVFDGNGSADQVFLNGENMLVNRIQPTDNHLSGGFSNPKHKVGGAIIRFIPAGVTLPVYVEQKADPSDSGKDRIWAGQSAWWEESDFFYRVDSENKETNMKKIGTYLLAAALLLSLAGCAPKRYERKHSPVGASSVKKSSDKAREKEQPEEAKSDENDKEAIGTLSKADQADIYSIIENSASLTYSLQVQPTRLLELNNDHSAVEGYSQDMFIDYYNTYTPETYNLQDIIDKLHAEETSDSIRSLSQDQLIQLTNEKKDGWIYSTKDKAFYEIVAGGRGGAMPPMEIPSPDEWVINEDSVEVTTTIQGTSDPYRRFVLKRNNKNYKGGTHKTRFYVDSTEFVKS